MNPSGPLDKILSNSSRNLAGLAVEHFGAKAGPGNSPGDVTKPFLQAHKAVLNSKVMEETLVSSGHSFQCLPISYIVNG